MRFCTIGSLVTAASAFVIVSAGAEAQVIAPAFAQDYVFVNLGSPVGVPANFGGLTIRADDPNVLYLGGAANTASAKIYAVSLARDAAGHIVGFNCGDAVSAFNAFGTYGGIDGGLEFGPGGVLFYTTYSDHHVCEIKPGSVSPDLLISLADHGIASSTGTLRFVPPGFAGAGRLKICSYNIGTWHDTSVVAQPDGTYALGAVGPAISIGGGPEGIVYIKSGNPQFPADSVIVSEYGTGRIVTYEIDANGDPIPATQRVVLTGLAGAEGATRDPISGDYLFSTYGGGNRVVAIRGFSAVSCLGDIDGSGGVDASDLAILLGGWGQSSSGAAGDLNTDCAVDASDLAILLGNWGNCG